MKMQGQLVVVTLLFLTDFVLFADYWIEHFNISESSMVRRILFRIEEKKYMNSVHFGYI